MKEGYGWAIQTEAAEGERAMTERTARQEAADMNADWFPSDAFHPHLPDEPRCVAVQYGDRWVVELRTETAIIDRWFSSAAITRAVLSWD